MWKLELLSLFLWTLNLPFLTAHNGDHDHIENPHLPKMEVEAETQMRGYEEMNELLQAKRKYLETQSSQDPLSEVAEIDQSQLLASESAKTETTKTRDIESDIRASSQPIKENLEGLIQSDVPNKATSIPPQIPAPKPRVQPHGYKVNNLGFQNAPNPVRIESTARGYGQSTHNAVDYQNHGTSQNYGSQSYGNAGYDQYQQPTYSNNYDPQPNYIQPQGVYPPPQPPVGCVDQSSLCPAWASQNQCENSPLYMNSNCKSSCKCNRHKIRRPKIKKHKGGCIDRRPSCRGWAKLKQCQHNPKYMNNNCKQSCNTCNAGPQYPSPPIYVPPTPPPRPRPVDCVLSLWAAWSGCTAPCGPGYKSRSRTIIQGPLHGGRPCLKTYESTSCYSFCGPPPTPPPIVSECRIGDWGAWSACSASCGPGSALRTRQIVSPSYGPAKPCPATTQTMPCNAQPCRREEDCLLGDWTPWTQCSATCGQGFVSRRRPVLVEPTQYGAPCDDIEQSQECYLTQCGEDCIWGPWGQWESCSVSCGAGETKRYREASQLAQGGGMPCQGSSLQTESCNTHACPLAVCMWGEWGRWDPCSVTCGSGLRRRYRHPVTSNHQTCPGPRVETASCTSLISCVTAETYNPGSSFPFPTGPGPAYPPPQPPPLQPVIPLPLPPPQIVYPQPLYPPAGVGCYSRPIQPTYTDWSPCNCVGQQFRFKRGHNRCNKIKPLQKRGCASPCGRKKKKHLRLRPRPQKLCKPSCYKSRPSSCCCSSQCRRKKRQITN